MSKAPTVGDEGRRRIMAAIRKRDIKPELIVRRYP
jgi:hypothetical protein